MIDRKIRVFEANMEHALKSWHVGGGRESREPGIAEMPFEQLLRQEGRDRESLARIQELHLMWQRLQLVANELASDPGCEKFRVKAARKDADDFWAAHADDFYLLADLDSVDEVNDYDWGQRIVGVKLIFRWILAEGFHPLKIMKRLYAVGRAMGIAPFTELTMQEQGMMFGETKAAVSWRMKILSGVLGFCGMRGKRLPGQKSPYSSANYSIAQIGNGNRANGKRARQGSFLRSLHVPKGSGEGAKRQERRGK